MELSIDNRRSSFVWLFFVICFLTCPLPGRGQFSVVSITPADGTVAVDTTITLEFIFNSAVDTTARFPYPGDFYLDLLILPDSLVSSPDSISISADRKTVRAHNLRLEPETRYVFGILAENPSICRLWSPLPQVTVCLPAGSAVPCLIPPEMRAERSPSSSRRSWTEIPLQPLSWTGARGSIPSITSTEVSSTRWP